MKITINIDCTPVEARQLAGLPDLQPMQERLTAELERRFLDAIRSTAPDAILQRWFGAWPLGVEAMRQVFENLAKARTGQTHTTDPERSGT